MVISHFCFSSPLPRFPPETDSFTSTSFMADENLLSALVILSSYKARGSRQRLCAAQIGHARL